MVQEKKLVDEVSGWLKIYDDGSVDRTWSRQDQFKFMVERVPPHKKFIDGVAVRNVIITNQCVRLYPPEIKSKDSQKLPIVLHFHGLVSPFLRRAPEHRLLAAIDDGFDTLIWLQTVAQSGSFEPWLEQHGDFNRVFLIGDSSGGNSMHEPVRDGNSAITVFNVGHARQVLSIGTAGRGHQGPPLHVPDGHGSATAQRAETVAVAAVRGGDGLREGHGDGVLNNRLFFLDKAISRRISSNTLVKGSKQRPSSCMLAMTDGLCCGGCCSVSMFVAEQDVTTTLGWVANHVRQIFEFAWYQFM
ncbi:Putative carboxylesterase 12 [Glycine soja]|uniref:Putative carboxylesterase 12 n=1 Tax=Glycine soja TaxID=3848 RepID=A0A0B2SUD7_GLYSO|nr:Putative carboxylesterase 12 [Glycine soja]